MASLSTDYVRWERRLTREIPFFTRIFSRNGATKILDAACGTGRHAARLAQEGYRVTGVDINTESLESARSHAEEQGAEVEFVEGSYLDLSRAAPGPFDALYSVGNALCFCSSADEVAQALRECRSVLRPGGVAIAQILNYVGIAERGERLDFVRPVVRDGVEQLVVKFFRFGEPFWDVEFVTLSQQEGTWEAELGGGTLLALEADTYRALWLDAGFESVELFGDYAGTPFDVHQARDAIAVAVTPA